MSPVVKKYIGKKRCLDIENRSGRKIAKNLLVPATIFYGDREGEMYPALKNRCVETAKLAQNSKLIIVKDAPHQIDFLSYMKAIKEELNFN